ncbi:MAG TPA: PAS domain-containing protein, partial [Afipia sp.]
MPINRPKSRIRTGKSAHTRGRLSVRRPKAVPKLLNKGRKISEIGEIVRKRAEAEAAIADAARSNARLREAIDILPQGIVFLDADGRYILWNKKYAEIYNKSADLFEEG